MTSAAASLLPAQGQHPSDANAGYIAAIYDWDEIARRFSAIPSRHREDTLYFIRHGQTTYNVDGLVTGQSDPPLTQHGRHEAILLGSMLPKTIDVIACSALQRARETMELAVAGHVHPSVAFVDERINEISLGVLEGKPRVHIEAFARGDIDYAPEGGESYRHAAQRIFSFVVDLFDQCAASTGNQTAAIFCHAGVLRIVASLGARKTRESSIFQTHVANTEGIVLRSTDVRLPSFWTSDATKRSRKSS